MIGNKTAGIKERQLENKKLEQEAKKMEEELDRIRKFKAMEIEKQKLKMEMKELEGIKQSEIKKSQEDALRGYGDKIKKETEAKVRQKLLNKKLVESSSPSEKEEDNDTENLKYFMSVVGLSQYFDLLVQNKITSLAKLRQIDEGASKKIGIPLKDMIKINKKLRSMGY